MLSGPDGAYAYTARGTMSTVDDGATVTDYTFDAFGRLTDFDGQVAYAYDGFDRVVDRAGVSFSYAGPGIDPVSDGTFTYGLSPGGRTISVSEGTDSWLAGQNRHGDLTHLFTTAGVIEDSKLYDPFGDVVGSSGTVDPSLGFQSDYTDPTSGDVWMGARWYNPATAAFLSRDTVFGELSTPVSLNRYTYASNNPLAFWDPGGRIPQSLINDEISASDQIEKFAVQKASTARFTALNDVEAALTQTNATPGTASSEAAETIWVSDQRSSASGRALPVGICPKQLRSSLVLCAEFGDAERRGMANFGASMDPNNIRRSASGRETARELAEAASMSFVPGVSDGADAYLCGDSAASLSIGGTVIDCGSLLIPVVGAAAIRGGGRAVGRFFARIFGNAPNGLVDDFANYGGEFVDDALRSPVVRPDLGNLSTKIQQQMGTRGWTSDLIEEAMQNGDAFPAVNKLGGIDTPATRYVSPTTGQSVVIDNATGEVVQVGGPGFLFD